MKTFATLASLLVLGSSAIALAGGAGSQPDPTIKTLATCNSNAAKKVGDNVKSATLYTVNQEQWGRQLPPNTAMKIELTNGATLYLPLVEGSEVKLGDLQHVYLDIDASLDLPTTGRHFLIDGKSYLTLTRDNAADQNEITILGNFEQGDLMVYQGTLSCK